MKSKSILLQLLEQSEETNRLLSRIADRLDAPIHPPSLPTRKDQAFDSVINAGEALKEAVELMRREPFAALKNWIDTVTLREKRGYDRERELLDLLKKLKPSE